MLGREVKTPRSENIAEILEKSAKGKKNKGNDFRPWWTSRQRPKEAMQDSCSGFGGLAQKLEFGQPCEEFWGEDSLPI